MQSDKLHINSKTEDLDYQQIYTDILTGYSKGIDKINSHINFVLTASEEDFLEIGSKLQKFSNNSRELSKLSLETSSFISEDILKNGIVELSWLLKEFSNHFTRLSDQIKNNNEQLGNIFSNIGRISQEFIGFRKTVKQLRMLGIFTKIESSKLGSEDAGFYQLAEYVDKLSGFIDEKVKVLLSKSGILTRELGQTITDLDKLEKEHKRQSNVIIQNTSISLDNFNNRYGLCSSNIKNISESANQLSMNVSDIVKSIQFHDIIRQQIEHARDALFDLRDSGNLLLQESSGNYKDSLDIIYDTCELQTYQLKYSSEEFTSAALGIIQNLKGIKHSITKILKDSCELLGTEEKHNNFSFKSLKDELTKISDGAKKNTQTAVELTESIMSVLEIIEELAKSISEIEDIGNEIELIALNARIKAAHIGNSGESLGVLSESIQKLSTGTKNQTETVSALLKTTNEISSKLKVDLESVESKENKNTLEMTDNKIYNLMTSMIKLENKTSEFLEILKIDINKLQSEINNAIDQFTIHNFVEESLSSSINELKKIVELIKPYISNKKRIDKNIENLEEKYTMQQERRIHKEYVQNSIESKDNSEKEIDESEFGSNVELF